MSYTCIICNDKLSGLKRVKCDKKECLKAYKALQQTKRRERELVRNTYNCSVCGDEYAKVGNTNKCDTCLSKSKEKHCNQCNEIIADATNSNFCRECRHKRLRASQNKYNKRVAEEKKTGKKIPVDYGGKPSIPEKFLVRGKIRYVGINI